MASNSGPSPSLDIGGLSSNIISDFGPILSLFGEQVAKQFMSQSMGWLDHIIFAMAPLGIITAIVGAIRVGGSRWLRAIIGRARENYATAEIELMSSTSHEVCEVWNGQNIVRIVGSPKIHEVIYKKNSEENFEGDNTIEGRTCDLYSLEEVLPSFLTSIRGKRYTKSFTIAEEDIDSKEHPRSPPNISLNINSYVPKRELYFVATTGIFLQSAILVYAYYSTYNSIFKLKLGISSPVIWAWYCTLIGTLSLITGVLGCCYIIDKSTADNVWQVQGNEEKMHILWLQKGDTLDGGAFGSYVIFTKEGRSKIITSCRNNKFTDQNNSNTRVFKNTTTAAAFLTLVGFILQFMGFRGMHWSISAAQVLATIIMTLLRTVVRRGVSEYPYCHKLPPNHEIDWLATRFADDHDRSTFLKGPDRVPKNKGEDDFRVKSAWGQCDDGFWDQECRHWRIVTGAENCGYGLPQPRGSNDRAQKVVETRKRLLHLIEQPSSYSDKATSIAAAIELVMNIPSLFNPKPEEEEFLWWMNVNLNDVLNAPEATRIELKIKKDSSRKWKADLVEIEAVLSLWMFSVSKEEESSSRDGFLRSGKASRQQSIRLLGPSTPSSRRDMKWWISDGLSKVLEVDLAEPTEKDSPRSATDGSGNQITIKPGDHHVVGFAGGEIESGVYKTRPLSEIPIVSASDGEGNLVPPVPTSSRFCLAAVSDAPLDLLFAQEMFSAFMWAFAKSPYTKQIEGQTKLQPQSNQSSNSSPDWQSFALQNTTLLKLAQNIESIGLGSLDEVYMSILPPLIAHCRLPDAEVLVDNIHQKTKELQLSGNWGEAGDLYLWAFEACSYGILDSGSIATPPTRESGASASEAEPTTPKALIKAAAVLMQFLQALNTETERYEILRAPRSREGIPDPMKKFKDGLVGLVGRPSEIKVFAELAWLYKRQFRDVDWKLLPGVRSEETPDFNITDIKNAKAFGLTKTHQAFISSRETSLEQKGVVIEADDAHKMDVLGWTPLHYAATVADNTLIRQLLEAGADWRSRDLGGWTPLHYAAASKKEGFEIHREYLKERIDLNSQGRDGLSPLHCSAISGNIHMARSLVESGANLQTFDNSRKTPLHWAAYHGFTDILNLMLGYGASSLACDESGKTPLHLAAIKGSSNVVTAVTKAMGGMIDIRERDGWTAMQMAAFYGHSGFIKNLLDSGADVNSRGGEYGNALQVAVRRGYAEVVSVLLDRGADVNTQGGKYGSALQAAAFRGHVEVVKLLLDSGADVNAQGGHYANALHVAASGGHVEVVKLLLDSGADVNAQGGHYGNALQAAASEGHVEVVKLLLDSGADANAQGGHYGNALQAAASGGHVEVVKLLLDSGAGVYYGNALHVAASEGHVKVVKLLLDSGADANAQGGHYGDALYVAASGGHVEVVKLLLDSGADVNAQGGHYGNALQAAASGGHVKVVKLLLDSGADVNAQGGHHGDALRAATNGRHAEVENVLLHHGADVRV